MNTGQMLITISAMVLLSMVIVNVNRNSLTNTANMDKTKYEIMAVSLANTLINEACSKSFDEASTDSKQISDVTKLSANLGKDPGELYRKDFDDFDDYNLYSYNTSSDTSIISADFDVFCRVFYVDPFTSLDSVGSKQYHKRIEVSVTSQFLNDGQDTVRLSKINSHYYFR